MTKSLIIVFLLLSFVSSAEHTKEKDEPVVCFGSSKADFEAQKRDFLKNLGAHDSIKIRWLSMDTGKLRPATPFGDFHFRLYPLITWFNWRGHIFFDSFIRRSVRPNAGPLFQLGESLIRASEIFHAVRSSGGVFGTKCATTEKASFRIAVNLEDVFDMALLQNVKLFKPIYFSIDDLLSEPNLTRRVMS